MSARARFGAAGLVLSGALVFSLLGVVSSNASAKPRGKVVSAKLTPNTSLTTDQATATKLVCRFSPASARVVVLLSIKSNATWVKVRSVTKKGTIKTYATTVKQLFGSRAVEAGQYRIKISADANTLTRTFTVTAVTAPSPPDTTGAPPGAPPGAPGAFGKTSPTNGATGQASSVTLSWSSSSGAESYEYCVDTTDNNDCDNSWVPMDLATSGSFRSRAHGVPYYWQVRAINAVGTTYADGGTWFSFTVSP